MSVPLPTVARELTVYKLDLVDVQEVRWDKRGTLRAGDYIFTMATESKIIHWEQDFIVHHGIVSAVKRVECVSNRVSYIILRGCWCNIIVLNVYAPSKEKSNDSEDSFYEELEQVVDHFAKYHMKSLLGDFIAKLGWEDIFKPTIGNERLHKNCTIKIYKNVMFKKRENGKFVLCAQIKQTCCGI